YVLFSPFLSRAINGSIVSYTDPVYQTYNVLNPATGAWAAVTQPRLAALSSFYGVGGVYFDAPAPSDPDYTIRPTNLPGPGEYQIKGVVDSLAWIRDTLKTQDPNFLTITENAPEAFMKDMDMLGGDGQIPYLLPVIFDYRSNNYHLDKYLGGLTDLQSVMFNPTVYHHSVPTLGIGGFAPNTVGGLGSAYWDLLHFHGARAALEGGGIPAMYEIGPYFGEQGLANHELAMGSSSNPDYLLFSVQGPRYADVTKELLDYRKGSAYLIDGEWWPRPDYNAMSVSTQIVVGGNVLTSYMRPDVVSATWRSTQPGMTNWFGLYFFTSESSSRTVNVTFDARQHGFPAGRIVVLYRTTPGNRTPLSFGINLVSFSQLLTRDRISHFEVQVL
ncbi:MAG TPA: hypothetical protein VFZ65_04200, partial [Planctomycetota bacterium]|nr:hypothetical protein [Planctomycetota bacterium]